MIVDILNVIKQCQRQEAKSQKFLYERFYGYALKIAFRYVYQYELAAYVTNDGFVKVFRHIGKFRFEGEGNPERLLMAWIKRIVINTAIDELRKTAMAPQIGTIPEWIWQKPEPSRQADQQLMYKELISYVKSLTPMYRTVFNLFVIDGYTHFEIAAALGISAGTSRSNLSRARSILQRIINERMNINKTADQINDLWKKQQYNSVIL